MAANPKFAAEDAVRHLENFVVTSSDPSKRVKYRLFRLIGAGAFGTVYTCDCEETCRPRYACKVIVKNRLNPKGLDNLRHEVEVLRAVQYESLNNVLVYQDLLETKEYVCIITRYMEGGALFDKIVKCGRFSEADARRILLQVLRGIGYLHANGICHRDIKPENLLCSGEEENFEVLIGDFGFSKFYREEIMSTLVGSSYYAAPEVLQQKGKYSMSCDIWSFGIVAFILLTGFHPFNDPGPHPNPDHIPTNVCSEAFEYDRSKMVNLTPSAQNFLTKLLQRDPANRPTAESLLMSDEWLNTSDAEPSVDLTPALPFIQNYSSLSSPGTTSTCMVTDQDLLSPDPFQDQGDDFSFHASFF